MATNDYIKQDIKGIKESFDNSTRISIMSYAAVPAFTIEETDQFSEIFTSTEGLSGTRALTELETPDTNRLQDGYSITLSDVRYGNSILVTETDKRKMKDGSVKVDTFLIRQRDNLLRDIKNKFVTSIHEIFNDAFTGNSYLAPDGVELCGVHSWNTPGAATWDNSSTAVLSATAVDAAVEFGGAFKDSSGKPMPQSYDTIFVKRGGAASREAKKLFAKDITPRTVNDVNIYEGEFTIIETPYLTSGTAWFMMDLKMEGSPAYAGIGDMPQLREPIVQNNEAIRTNATGYWKVGIRNMPFNIYGSDGTA